MIDTFRSAGLSDANPAASHSGAANPATCATGMETRAAVSALSALAHEGRLNAFRILIQAGHQGVASGEIARRLGIPANTLSASLNVLSHAGLIESRREGKSIIYSVRYEHMTDVIAFLLRDCCNGAPEICVPLADALRTSCGSNGGQQ